MDSVFSNPEKVKELIKKGMEDKLEAGELDQLEFEQLETGLRTPSKTQSYEKEALQLRGDGGSGEPKIDLFQQVDEMRKREEEESWELGEETGGKEDWQESREGGEGSEITSVSDQLAAMKKDIANLKLFVDDQAKSLNAIIVPLQSRIQRLEAKSSPSIPVASIGSLHQRQQSGGGTQSPPRPTTRSGVGVPHAGSANPVVSLSAVEAFTAKNRDYPSLKAVRDAKLHRLQVEQGLVPQLLKVGVADWNASRLYQILCDAHEQ